jgi:osmoprotectant transport system permease protein
MIDPTLFAAAGQVGEDFFKERSTDSLPCQANNANLFCWDWAKNNIDRYEPFFIEHVELVVISVLIGFVAAFALALLAHRWHRLRLPFLLGTGVLYTIPSVAFFFLLLPLTGRGRDTAIIALSVYTLQIIYRNTMLGLDNVPSASIDAARGMGMTRRQVLRKVELPLALPEIGAGLIIATVSTVAIATLAALAGGGGLGEVIVGRERGLGIDFKTNLIIAGGLTVGLAIVFGLLLMGAQRLLTPWRRVKAV